MITGDPAPVADRPQHRFGALFRWPIRIALLVLILLVALMSGSVIAGLLIAIISFIPTAIIAFWARNTSSADVRQMDSLTLQIAYWRGFLLVIGAFVVELVISLIVSLAFSDVSGLTSKLIFTFLTMFITPGVVEELYKWWLTSFAIKYHRSLQPPQPLLTHHQIVTFGVLSALGFATCEDMIYAAASLFSGGFGLALFTIVVRVVLFPLHLSLGARSAKEIAKLQMHGGSPFAVRFSRIWPQMVIHGTFDFCLTLASFGQSDVLPSQVEYLLVIPLLISIAAAVYLWRTLAGMRAPSQTVPNPELLMQPPRYANASQPANVSNAHADVPDPAAHV